jgi:hypothetical protein
MIAGCASTHCWPPGEEAYLAEHGLLDPEEEGYILAQDQREATMRREHPVLLAGMDRHSAAAAIIRARRGIPDRISS